ncbi:glycerol-3-phosphate responsive antiterminator [Macrococcus sp. CCM 2573]
MILPAIRSMKDLEKFVMTQYSTCVILDMHIGHISNYIQFLNQHQKSAFIHIDLIKGMSSDEYATEYVIQKYKVDGIVSTKPKIIKRAKQLGVKTILRTFIIDSNALKKSYELIQSADPDFVEVLPGLLYKAIENIHKVTGKKIIAGGLIGYPEEVEKALAAGATYVTTSNKDLWKHCEIK